jgi:hypothetical protein
METDGRNLTNKKNRNRNKQKEPAMMLSSIQVGE